MPTYKFTMTIRISAETEEDARNVFEQLDINNLLDTNMLTPKIEIIEEVK